MKMKEINVFDLVESLKLSNLEKVELAKLLICDVELNTGRQDCTEVLIKLEAMQRLFKNNS